MIINAPSLQRILIQTLLNRSTDRDAPSAAAYSFATYLPVAAVAPSPQPYRRARSDNRAGLVAAVVIALLVLVPVLQTIIPGPTSAAGTSTSSPSPTVMSVVPRLVGTVDEAVPSVVGLTVTAAIEALKASGFVPAPGQLSAGARVGGSNPMSGQVKRIGTTVTLYALVVTPSATPTPSATVETPSPSPSTTPSATVSTTRSTSPGSASRPATPSASGGP